MNGGDKRLSGLSIVMPAYNEEANVERAVRTARAAAERFAKRWEIVIVNDGSVDATGDRVRAEAAKDSTVRLEEHEVNRGYGAAVRTGLQSASMPYVFFTDSDLQFDLDEIERLLPLLDDAAVAVGYRADRQDSWIRWFNGAAWSWLQWMLFRLDVRDVDCAFKIFRREVIAHMPMESEGAFVSTEILLRARAAGHRIRETPVSHYPRTAGAPTGARIAVISRAFRELWSFRLRMGSMHE